jgi:hypothetical protein
MRRLSLLLLLALTTALPAPAVELDEPMKSVEAVRQRTFLHEVERQSMKRADLRAYLLEQIAHSARSADDYRSVLEMMQFVDHDPQLIEKMLHLYEAQVLAFYDPQKHVYFSLDTPPEGIAPNAVLDDVIAVHELTHALQDQLFDAGKKIEGVEEDWDREMAYHSVLEGEATLVMLGQLYRTLGQPLETMLADDTALSAMMKAAESAGGIPSDAPKFFVESLKFPYLDGFRFVVAAFRRDGWKGVDALHANPPLSSEEVLHPDVYLARLKESKEEETLPLERDAYFSTRLGEFFWRELVGEDAAQGADVSRFTIRRNGKKQLTAFIETRWDTEAFAEHFASAYERFLYSRDIHPLIRREGRVVRVSYGADAKAGRTFVKQRATRNAQRSTK